ncbi:50S ribosomal protein L4 [Candidatus Microgenomates bacterium]|nr:50S ribosomal protein L4 [Candidatus Microgenomates bacterium]
MPAQIATRATKTVSKPAAPLPKELFGQKPNINLLSQAYYIYESRSHPGTHKTQTRGEVTATTAKVYRQKGTGRARHGSKKAPIYVGGGVVFGPTGVKRSLSLSKSLSRRALAYALSARASEGKVFVVDGKNFDGKTKTTAKLLGKLETRGRILVLHGGENEVIRSSRNITNVNVMPANMANAYEIINNRNLVVTASGLQLLQETFGKVAKK